MLATTSDTQMRVAQQQWQVQQGNQHYVLDVIVERSAGHWRWIMLNNLGQRLATAEAKRGQVRIEQQQSHPVNRLLPTLLQAWQFSYWPLADLQSADPHWLFADSTNRREVRFSGILRATIEYPPVMPGISPWQGSLTYDARPLRLLIHSQSLN